ncbi:MAG TPA: HD domain-containing protein [Gemmatimonadaceae bacterium]|nr:HD domain-containing protein [Gemmatimonadaceae bacterium]
MRFEILRDPLWNNVRVDELTLELIDTDPFQRLRYVRQLGLAYLVYPGATHSRFEHALGAYHLARQTLAMLAERGSLEGLDHSELPIVRAAALLHDIGHYPFSHALEEIGQLHHEDVARPLITSGVLAEVLARRIAPDAPQRIYDLVRGVSQSPLQGLISGSLDLDKIDYLKRDAVRCGVPYGEIDVERLTNSMVVVDDPETHRRVIGVLEKGLSALESLLFAKYQMYRNVYWHHAVRSATAMYKRMVDDALRSGAVDSDLLPSYTDEGLLHRLEHAAPTSILEALRSRRLYKRALEWSAGQLDDGYGEWIATDRDRTRAAEDQIAEEMKLAPGEVILDFPMKAQMLGLDIAVQRRSGEVERLTGEGWPGTINLPSLSEELYRSARWLRVFVARRMTIPVEMVRRVLEAHS